MIQGHATSTQFDLFVAKVIANFENGIGQNYELSGFAWRGACPLAH